MWGFKGRFHNLLKENNLMRVGFLSFYDMQCIAGKLFSFGIWSF